MKSKWPGRMIATAIFTLAAVAVAWANREALYYLDAWMKFTSIALVPVLFLTVYYVWDKSHPHAGAHWKTGLAVSFTVVISLTTVWLTFTALFISLTVSMTSTSNARKYDFIVGKWNSPFTAHFPRPIPADVRDVRFFFNPGFLQSASILELGYTTTPERIDALYREYSRLSTLAFAAGTKNGIIEPMNYVAAETQELLEFSDDYTLFYLDEEPPTDEKNWNHPESHGVAISKKRCRIIFWAWSG